MLLTHIHIYIYMIHYNHNTGKHTNIQLNKPKAHALQNHRNKQTVANVKDIATRAIITLAFTTVLAVTYLIKTS